MLVLELFVLYNSSMNERHCVLCGTSFLATRAWQKYCSKQCQTKNNNDLTPRTLKAGRFCKQCGTNFFPDFADGKNRQHCSNECSVKSARDSRSKFWEKHGKEKEIIYRQRTKEKIGKDSNLKRFRKRYPEIEIKCQSCGEQRVVDIAHKPEHKRNGEWRSAKNTTPEKVWILCPTCHALLDRMNYSPSELGLS